MDRVVKAVPITVEKVKFEVDRVLKRIKTCVLIFHSEASPLNDHPEIIHIGNFYCMIKRVNNSEMAELFA